MVHIKYRRLVLSGTTITALISVHHSTKTGDALLALPIKHPSQYQALYDIHADITCTASLYTLNIQPSMVEDKAPNALKH